MKLILADWGENANGSRYTIHFCENTSDMSVFWSIDTLGDPSHVKYKVLTLRSLCDAGIDYIDCKELEGSFEFLYEIAGKERDFKKA